MLPKVPDQSAYYLRQLYQYNLIVVVINSKCPQIIENTSSFQWKETDYLKSSNEVASAVYIVFFNTPVYKPLQLSGYPLDSCSGQSENITMIGMLF